MWFCCKEASIQHSHMVFVSWSTDAVNIVPEMFVEVFIAFILNISITPTNYNWWQIESHFSHRLKRPSRWMPSLVEVNNDYLTNLCVAQHDALWPSYHLFLYKMMISIVTLRQQRMLNNPKKMCTKRRYYWSEFMVSSKPQFAQNRITSAISTLNGSINHGLIALFNKVFFFVEKKTCARLVL